MWHSVLIAIVILASPIARDEVRAPLALQGLSVERTLRTEPAAGREPRLPVAFRRQTLLIAALFTILATAAALWQTKRAVIAIVVIAVVVLLTVAGAHLWQQRRPATPAAAAESLHDYVSVGNVSA